MNTFREMLVWQKAMDMVVEIYSHTKAFPKDETFGLTSQIRRCAVSIPSNLAEGYGRNSKSELHRFASIAAGSLFEMQTQLDISFRLNYISEENHSNLYEQTREIERMLVSLIRKLQE